MYHGGNQHCIGFALLKSVSKVFDFAPAAGSDHRHGNSFGNHPGYGQFIAVADPVGINGIETNFSGTQFNGFFCPFYSIKSGGDSAAFDINFISGGDRRGFIHGFYIHTQNDTLSAEGSGSFGKDPGISDRKGVDRNLVGSGKDHLPHICYAADAASHAEGYENLFCHTFDHFNIDFTVFSTGGDIVKNQFVSPVFGIKICQFHRITDVAVICEFHTFGHPAVPDIQTNDQALQQHDEPSHSKKFFSNCKPVSPLRSGWN